MPASLNARSATNVPTRPHGEPVMPITGRPKIRPSCVTSTRSDTDPTLVVSSVKLQPPRVRMSHSRKRLCTQITYTSAARASAQDTGPATSNRNTSSNTNNPWASVKITVMPRKLDR